MSFTLEKKFCVYVDYTDEVIQRAFYVGKGNQARLSNYDRNEIHKRITEKYGCVRKVVFETNDEQESHTTEIQFITDYKTYAHGGEGYWGANLTLGGDGTSGWIPSEETRQRIGIASAKKSISDVQKEMISRHQKELWSDSEYRESLLNTRAKSVHHWNEHEREHLSILAKERWSDPDKRAKYIENNKRRWTPERRKQHSETMKKTKAKHL